MDALSAPFDDARTLELVLRVQRGESGAWAELYGAYHDELLLLTRARLGPKLRAALESEDVLQSVARAVGNTRMANPLPVALEGMDFGNWAARPDQPEWGWERMAANGYAVRNFVGRLDEFAILARALGAEEIRRLYETGAVQ